LVESTSLCFSKRSWKRREKKTLPDSRKMGARQKKNNNITLTFLPFIEKVDRVDGLWESTFFLPSSHYL
jgi:hypothetical protein